MVNEEKVGNKYQIKDRIRAWYQSVCDEDVEVIHAPLRELIGFQSVMGLRNGSLIGYIDWMRNYLLPFAGLLGGSDRCEAGNNGGVGEPQAGACGIFVFYGGVLYK